LAGFDLRQLNHSSLKLAEIAQGMFAKLLS
jgi:hypothetical protein